MNYSDKHKICWVTPMRTATRSCLEIQKGLDFDRYGFHEIYNYQDKLSYDLLFNIRSPYPRIVSLYKIFCHHNQNNFSLDFDSWVKNVTNSDHRKFNFYYNIHLDDMVNQCFKKPDYLIKVEYLEKDLKKIPSIKDNFSKISDIFTKNILHNNFENEFGKFSEKAKLPWQNFYNQKIADLVFTATENQFEIFNYNRDFWKDGTP